MAKKPVTVLPSYGINHKTVAVLPTTYDKQLCARVIEMQEEYIVSMTPKEIIDNSCRYFGSSLDGRRKGTEAITGITHKAPIAIDPSNMIYFFPTHSPKQKRCAWISHQLVETYNKISESKVCVTFTNRKKIDLPISNNTFENQLHRTAHLRFKLFQRLRMNREPQNIPPEVNSRDEDSRNLD